LLGREEACLRCLHIERTTPRKTGARDRSAPSTSDTGPATLTEGAEPGAAGARPEVTRASQPPPSEPLDTQLSAGDPFAIDPEDVPASAAPILAGFLVSYTERLGRYWPLLQGKNRIGRRVERTHVGPDLPLDEATVSLEHAIIHASAVPGRMKIEDLKSRNGTYVDGVRILPGQKLELRDGQLLTLGEFRAIVKIV
jgi:pSer/pThr/pTyr-binding forkhead associated (FHA) protein